MATAEVAAAVSSAAVCAGAMADTLRRAAERATVAARRVAAIEQDCREVAEVDVDGANRGG